jgi:hypothetical protein
VLTDGARADSVPNLEIETGEILGAGHASATGRFDDEQLFYLHGSRHPEGEARRLVVRGLLRRTSSTGSPSLSCRATSWQAIERSSPVGLAEVGPPDEPTLTATLTPTSDPRTADR